MSSTPTVFKELPYEVAERIRQRLGVSQRQMAADIGITMRMYKRRSETGRLSSAESLKVEMFASLLEVGERVFGGREEAKEWLRSPIMSVGGGRPIDLLDSIKGYERVRAKLLQIEYGTY